MIMAGGTGGHVYPALAVAHYLREQQYDVVWLGTRNGLEATVVPENNIPLCYLNVAAVRGSGFIRKLLSPFIVLWAIFQAINTLLQQKPDVVLGMGGFASGPGGVAAFLLRIPLCIHEQNAVAGLTNRLLKPIATKVMQAFPNTFNNSGKLITTGNPVRKNILELGQYTSAQASDPKSFNLLVIGGSLGARKLNEVVPLALQQLQDSVDINVRHQTGVNNLAEAKQHYKQLQVAADVLPFIDDMADAYRWADFVICRSGAMTIAELSIVGIASILIPYPYAVDDHQTLNARYLSDQGYAILIPQSKLTVNSLAEAIEQLCVSHEYLSNIANRVRELGRPAATHQVAEQCMELMHA